MILSTIKQESEIPRLIDGITTFAQRAVSNNQDFYVSYGTDKSIVNKNYTDKQRSSLHVWCRQVAKTLNDAGHFHRKIHPFTGMEIEGLWNERSVKEDLYKPTLYEYCKKNSTEDQSTIEPSFISESLATAYAKFFGICLPFWPSKERAR